MANPISCALKAIRKLTTRAIQVTFSTDDFYLWWDYQELVLSESSIPKVGDIIQLKGIPMIVSQVGHYPYTPSRLVVRVLSIHGIVNNPSQLDYPFPRWILQRAREYLKDSSSFEVTDLEEIILEKKEYEDPRLAPGVLEPLHSFGDTW